jgi:hypothetical protein
MGQHAALKKYPHFSLCAETFLLVFLEVAVKKLKIATIPKKFVNCTNLAAKQKS